MGANMIASLMMYARPELRAAHTRFWTLIRARLALAGIDAPATLSQDMDEFEVWKHPQLVLSQTCGMPYRLWLHDLVKLVGTPDYGLAGCPPGYYRSAIVVRGDDRRDELDAFRDAVFAYNQTFSQSGYAAMWQHLKQHGFWFENSLHTEQHISSARAVCDGRADIAALDAVTWRLLQKYEDFSQELRVLDWTVPTPGLPLITGIGRNSNDVFDAFEAAISLLNADDRAMLGVQGIVKIPKEVYFQVGNPPTES
jgi:ABC-type phosphate/phosphonate transport system substrate-binding protein